MRCNDEKVLENKCYRIPICTWKRDLLQGPLGPWRSQTVYLRNFASLSVGRNKKSHHDRFFYLFRFSLPTYTLSLNLVGLSYRQFTTMLELRFSTYYALLYTLRIRIEKERQSEQIEKYQKGRGRGKKRERERGVVCARGIFVRNLKRMFDRGQVNTVNANTQCTMSVNCVTRRSR